MSKYVRNNRFYFSKTYNPTLHDHDFPLVSRLKINMTGFLKLHCTGNTYIDFLGRKTYENPKH